MVSPISDKPPLEAYPTWLLSNLEVNVRTQEAYYDLLSANLLEQFRKSRVWRALLDRLPDINDSYKRDAGDDLITNRQPQIVIKPFSSFLEKTFRRNIKDNDKFPEPPSEGWCIPPNWYTEIHDIVRTTLVVKYLDGCEYLGKGIVGVGRSNKIQIPLERRSTFMGYYAVHLDYPLTLTVTDINMEKRRRGFFMEIQITTEVKQALQSVLHQFYESARKSRRVDATDWVWRFGESEFVGNNLGHILHYVEGMIVRLRDEMKESR